MTRLALAAAGIAIVAVQAASAATPPSPAGLWKADTGRVYKWVAQPGGKFVEYSMTPHVTATNRCPVRKNDAVYRYAPTGKGIYRVTARFWRSGCASYWAYDKTIKIVVTPTKMTRSCDRDFATVCRSYTRKSAAKPRDMRPPTVHALTSQGAVGADTVLRYTVSDDSGKSWEELTIYQGGKAVRHYKTTLGAAKAGRVYAYRLKQTPATFSGSFRFCVRSHDAAGNVSPSTCSTLAIRPAAATTTSPRSARSIKLAIGDVIDVTGTRIACFAITSNSKKNGIACVLVGADGKPQVGSYGAGLAVDGTAVVNHLKADGSTEVILERRLQSSATTYRVTVGDSFGLPVSSTVSLGCRVIDVTSKLVEPLYRGVKVSCWRATAAAPLPKSYGVSISDRFAGAFTFDAKGRVSKWGVVRREPAAKR